MMISLLLNLSKYLFRENRESFLGGLFIELRKLLVSSNQKVSERCLDLNFEPFPKLLRALPSFLKGFSFFFNFLILLFY